MPYRGRCACGSITAEIAGEPVATRQCWCSQCQQLAAGGPTHNAIFRAADVTLRGELATNGYIARSGNTLTRSYCGGCGTPVLAQSTGRPQFRTIRFGFLEPGHGLAPRMAIFTAEAPPWAVLDPRLEQFAGMPPLPPSD
jgi:hypothetical protein